MSKKTDDEPKTAETIPISKYEGLKDFFLKELERRDKEIDRLKKENTLVVKTALKQSDRNEKWSHYAEKLEKRVRKLEDRD